MRWAVLIASLLVFATAAVASAETCDAPLPDDINVKQAPGGLPAEQAALLGTWAYGKWDGVLCNALVIEDINTDGSVHFVYAWGTYAGWNIYKGHARGTGKIDGSTLRMIFGNGAKVSYQHDGDRLHGTYEISGNTYKVTLPRK